MKFNYAPGATPIDPSILIDLKQPQITTQSELNEAEESNIAESRLWSRTRRRSNLLSERFVCELHRRMFGNVWKWAGKFRTIELQNSVFSHPWEVRLETRNLIADSAIVFGTDNLGSRELNLEAFAAFHHRLVKIHPFNNGNGRHAREMTDLLAISFAFKPFTWGAISLDRPSKTRDAYIAALRAGDEGDISQLLKFMNS